MAKSSSVAASLPATFELAMAELEQLVRDLEAGKVSLDEALAKYERGKQLQAFCETRLNDAQMKIERIGLDATGQPHVVPHVSE